MQFIARQPILDVQQKTQGYELLFRETAENNFSGGDPDMATKKAMDTAVLIGLDVLSGGHSVFLNCPYALIVEGYPTLLPPEVTVIEVLETVKPDKTLIAACKRLKEAGYRIALDDFVDQEPYAPLVELADIIKVDLRATPPDTCARLAQQYGRNGRQMLAEKVETHEEFETSMHLGYELFQGYFFCKPKVLSTPTVPQIDPKHLRVLRALSRPQLNFIELEQLIKTDPALCYRLLRYLNSPAFYLQTEIRSILHALVLLGEAEVRKWLLLVCAIEAAGARKPELVNAALVRARFAELLGVPANLSESALFLVGLLSLMDAMLDTPREALLAQVALPADVRAALLGEANRLRQCHDVVVAYESADWATCDEKRKRLHIPEAVLRSAYLDAVKWAKVLAAA